MKTGLHRGDAGSECSRDLRVTAAFLHQCEENPVLRTELGEGVAEGVELLGIDGTGRFGNVFVLGCERQKNAAELLAAEVIDAGVARESEQPRLELLRRLESRERAHHFDKHELREILDGVAPPDDRINETSHAVLVGDDEVALSIGVVALGAADEVDQWGRRSWFHAVGIAIIRPDAGARQKMRLFRWRARRVEATFPGGRRAIHPRLIFPQPVFFLARRTTGSGSNAAPPLGK